MTNSAMTDRWLSVEEIAEYLGISKDTVYGWISKKGMPAHRLGRFWKFQRVEVDTWVRSGGADESATPTNIESPSQNQEEPKAKGSKA
jgi:excisionase family DNA binding protein